MPTENLNSEWETMCAFTIGNLQRVEELLENVPEDLDEDSTFLKDTLEVLQQSLIINNALLGALNQKPILRKYILATVKGKQG